MMSSLSSNLHVFTSDDEMHLRKFESLKELRDVTVDYLERKSLLHNALKAVEEESDCLETYKQEKDFLEQEKFDHAEKLRLIHSDLHEIDTIIQESEREADHHITMAKNLHLEWQQVRNRADKIRSALGLDKIESLPEEERLRHLLTKIPGRDDGFSMLNQSFDSINGFKPLLMIANQTSHSPQHPFFFPNSTTTSSSKDYKPSHTPSSSSMGISALMNPIHGPPSGLMSTGGPTSIAERPPNRSSFCQQPPPMKSCLTCLQQIHRNAPICPNCKAKSRSRNPKKPKRKTED